VELTDTIMKRLILTSVVAAFACVSAMQAGEDCDKTKAAACADKAKVAAAEQAKAGCAASACCAKETKAKARVVSKTLPKGAMLLVQR